MKKLKTFYIRILLTILLLGSVVTFYLFISEKLDLSRDLTISDFVVCNKSTLSDEQSTANWGGSFTKDDKELYACGYINAKNPRISCISILLFINEKDTPLYVSPVDLQFNKGFFCHEIILPSDNKDGLFSVKVYYFRKIVAASKFEIR
jgi:hypothetical protein